MIEVSGSGAGSIPLTNGSGSVSKSPKNMWIRWFRIRIRIRNTGYPIPKLHLTPKLQDHIVYMIVPELYVRLAIH
jgi:hypothetical protein